MLRMVVYPNDNQEQCYNKVEIIKEGEDFECGESVNTANTVSKLDIYLDKLYEKKVKFTVENDVVDFIQHGVEILVQDLMKFVMKQDEIQTEIAALKETYSGATFMDKSELLRVGSYYEGTRNTFPDEFDFIYVVLCSSTPKLKEHTGDAISIFDTDLLYAIQQMIHFDINNISDYAIKMYENSQYTLEFVETGNLEYPRGPNVKLKLRFQRKDSTRNPAEVNIFVDITPGIKILATYKNFISLICPLKPFAEEVCVDDSFLLVLSSCMETKITFTETEVKLMNQKLSCRHRKVYRLLKYVINANVDEEELRSLRKSRYSYNYKFWLSSYELKMFMIYHHFECKRDERAAVSCCLIDILERIQSCFSTAEMYIFNGVEIVGVLAGIRPLVYNHFSDITDGPFPRQIQLFHDKRKYVELVKTLLSDLISDLKSKTNHDCRDCSFVAVTSFSERLHAHLQRIKLRKEKKEKRTEKLGDFLNYMVLVFFVISAILFIPFVYHLSMDE